MKLIMQAPISFPVMPQSYPVQRSTEKFNTYNLATIMAGSGIGGWAFDAYTMQLNVCPVFKKLLQLPNKQAYDFRELIHMVALSSRKMVLDNLKNACNAAGGFQVELMLKEQPGNDCRWLKLTGNVYHTPGQLRGTYMGTITDITEAKTRELWNNDRLALVSHELKGPLSVIKLYIQRAGKIITDGDIKDAALFLNKADSQVSAMALLMDDFLSFSTIGNAKMKLCFKCFDICALLDDVVAQMQLKHPGYQFNLQTPQSIAVKADKRKITQVMLNYLSNAVKYSAANSCIDIKCSIEKGELNIAVKDKGIGINPAFHEKVFDRYYRTPGTNADGFGLGLYLVKEIVTQHGGRVWVKSDINKGSAFYFALPCYVADDMYNTTNLI